MLVAVAAAVAVVVAIGMRIAVSAGLAIPELPKSLLVTLPSIAIVLGALGIPMFRYHKGLRDLLEKKTQVRPKRPDPFYAVRVLLLSKAAAISGALFTGVSLGLIATQLTAPVLVWSSIGFNIVGAAGALLMVIVALLVERACRLPDDGAAGNEAADSEAAPA
ncbi:MAG: hypothetical protein RL670_1173 [Actinomycetota bacterium]|jgi:hypothetical protein